MSEIMSVKDTSKMLGVGELTIYTWLAENKLPGVKIGRRWLIRRADIDRMFDRQVGASEEKKGE